MVGATPASRETLGRTFDVKGDSTALLAKQRTGGQVMDHFDVELHEFPMVLHRIVKTWYQWQGLYL